MSPLKNVFQLYPSGVSGASKKKHFSRYFKNMAFIQKKMWDVCVPVKTAMELGQKCKVYQIPVWNSE